MESRPARSDSREAEANQNPLVVASASARNDPDDLCGVVLADRYRLMRFLGQGGMGSVYVAEHVALGKSVAIKVLGTRWARDVTSRDRFLIEARAASKIDHENVVDVFDYGITPNSSVFLAMELLRGEPLSELVAREGPLAWPRAKGIVLQVCRALHAAHDKGVLHRDIKPENCFRTKRGANRDFIKVFDFGLAKIIGSEDDPHSSLTKVGSLFGTPEYMSPEQARGKKVDARADVYSTGILVYELVTGQVPFTGDNFMDILTRQCGEAPAPPRAAAPNATISVELERVILRALQKDAGERFQSMRELAEAIAAVPTFGPTAVVPTRTTVTLPATPSVAGGLSTATRGAHVAVMASLSVAVLLLAIALAIVVLRG